MSKTCPFAFTTILLTCLCPFFGCTSTGPQQWSIGVYEGTNPFELRPAADTVNPVLTAAHVTDVSAEFVADPFMVREDGTWFMFFEVMNAKTRQGDIGLATSDDGLHWRYQRIVLDEPFHLSYPCVFRWGDGTYMIPESHQAGGVRLYKADRFPDRWSFVGVLLRGGYVDPTVFRYNDRWWMFAGIGDASLHLFGADHLKGPWTPHPKSPVVTGTADVARPGGRVVMVSGRPVRFAQDDFPTYGNQVRAFEITRLTLTDYEEREVPGKAVLSAGGRGWHADGMHHIDAHKLAEDRWFACVDGCRLRPAHR